MITTNTFNANGFLTKPQIPAMPSVPLAGAPISIPATEGGYAKGVVALWEFLNSPAPTVQAALFGSPCIPIGDDKPVAIDSPIQTVGDRDPSRLQFFQSMTRSVQDDFLFQIFSPSDLDTCVPIMCHLRPNAHPSEWLAFFLGRPGLTEKLNSHNEKLGKIPPALVVSLFLIKLNHLECTGPQDEPHAELIARLCGAYRSQIAYSESTEEILKTALLCVESGIATHVTQCFREGRPWEEPTVDGRHQENLRPFFDWMAVYPSPDNILKFSREKTDPASLIRFLSLFLGCPAEIPSIVQKAIHQQIDDDDRGCLWIVERLVENGFTKPILDALLKSPFERMMDYKPNPLVKIVLSQCDERTFLEFVAACDDDKLECIFSSDFTTAFCSNKTSEWGGSFCLKAVRPVNAAWGEFFKKMAHIKPSVIAESMLGIDYDWTADAIIELGVIIGQVDGFALIRFWQNFAHHFLGGDLPRSWEEPLRNTASFNPDLFLILIELPQWNPVLIGEFLTLCARRRPFSLVEQIEKLSGPGGVPAQKIFELVSIHGDIFLQDLYRITLTSQQRAIENAETVRQQARHYSPWIALSDGFILYSQLSSDLSSNDIERIRKLAIVISKAMDGRVRGPLRESIHNDAGAHNLALIEDYQRLYAQDRAAYDAIASESAFCEELSYELQELHLNEPLLESALREIDRLSRALYEPVFDRAAFKRAIPAPLSAQIRWPSDHPTLEEIGNFAISIREANDALRAVNADAPAPSDQTFALMELARCADILARGLAAPEPEEPLTRTATKMAALVRVLYGCGFGGRGYLAVAEDLDRVASGTSGDPDRTPERLRRNAILVAGMLRDYERSFRSVLQPIAMSEIREDRRATFVSSQYRSTGIFLLGETLARLNAFESNENVTDAVLSLLALPQPGAAPYAAAFFGDANFPDNRLWVGGKGAGLNELARRYPELTPRGFVLPPRAAGHVLTASEKETIAAALDELETRTGKRLGDDLSVSVRSGAAVSMPGAMNTVLNLGSCEGVLSAIEAVYASWDAPAAVEFRRRNGIPDGWGTAVNVVAMVDGTRDSESGSGIATADRIVFGARVAGTELVSGTHAGQDALQNDVASRIATIIESLEASLRHPVEIEFTVESSNLYLLQVRHAHLTREDEIAWYAGAVARGRMSRHEAVKALGGKQRLNEERRTFRVIADDTETPLGRGRGENAPFGGQLAFDDADIAFILKSGARAIYVTDNPDAGESAASAMRAGAFLVSGGNALAHLFDVARDQRLPFLVLPFRINDTEGTIEFDNGTASWLDHATLDPNSGRLFSGRRDIVESTSPVSGHIEALLAQP